MVALAFATTYGADPHSFAAVDLVGIAALALSVNGILLAATAWFVRSRVVANALIAGTVLAGLLTMHVVHTEIYRDSATMLIVLSCAAYVVVFIGMHAIDDHPWAGVVLAAITLAGVGVALFRPHHERSPVPTVDQREIREITFQQRPNVYLVGFDGMTPAALLERFDVERTPFHDLMSSRFRVFRNFFTSDVMTMRAYNALLTLDEHILDRYAAAFPSLRMFAGTHDAPLFRLFRRNGYEITTLYKNRYFGSRGPYVDNHVTMRSDAVCGQLDAAIRDLSFYGYCAIGVWLTEAVAVRTVGSMKVESSASAEQRIVQRSGLEWPQLVLSLASADQRIAQRSGLEWPQLVLSSASADQRIVDRIVQRIGLERPQLVLAHIDSPGHAGSHFDMRNQDDMAAFSARYLADIDYAAELLAQIVDHLEVHDPNAILFVFGDHGPVLTQGMDPSDDLPFYITDRYATIGGVFPSHRCASHLGPPADRAADYTTTLDAMHGILRCLSGGRSATRTQRADRMIVRQGLPYEAFLYE